MRPERDPTLARELRAGVAALVRNGEGQILLQRRSDNGLWGLPGGAVEIGESVRQAIVREVEEETGLHVEVERLIGVYSDPAVQIVRYPDGNVVHYVSSVFACRIRGGTLQTCAETLELRFFDPHALPEALVPMHRVRIADGLANRPEAFIR